MYQTLVSWAACIILIVPKWTGEERIQDPGPEGSEGDKWLFLLVGLVSLGAILLLKCAEGRYIYYKREQWSRKLPSVMQCCSRWGVEMQWLFFGLGGSAPHTSHEGCRLLLPTPPQRALSPTPRHLCILPTVWLPSWYTPTWFMFYRSEDGITPIQTWALRELWLCSAGLPGLGLRAFHQQSDPDRTYTI